MFVCYKIKDSVLSSEMVSENSMTVKEMEFECSVLSLCITERQTGLIGADVGPITRRK